MASRSRGRGGMGCRIHGPMVTSEIRLKTTSCGALQNITHFTESARGPFAKAHRLHRRSGLSSRTASREIT